MPPRWLWRRVWHGVLALGEHCGLHRIKRLMRERALPARPRRRGLPKDLGERSAFADNVLDSQFQADAPSRNWVGRFSDAAWRAKFGSMQPSEATRLHEIEGENKRVQELNISERSAFRYADSPERTARIRAARTIARPS